jgi:hypothetical protein
MNARPYNLDHFQRLQNRQALVEPGSVLRSRLVAGNSGKTPLTGFHSTLGRLLPLYRAGQEVKKAAEL